MTYPLSWSQEAITTGVLCELHNRYSQVFTDIGKAEVDNYAMSAP